MVNLLRKYVSPARVVRCSMTSIVHIIQYQEKKTYQMYCDRCGNAFEQQLPLSMRLTQVVCPHCKTDGFVIGRVVK